ncbi:MAG: DegT/DnrJ/EryC1/StrS aminotransferase family protein [Actinobacteria bacterium]|nr:DegT/DnrJ/EryC1/StrS aminotransferase family protein [Actinomycetota bacterium]
MPAEHDPVLAAEGGRPVRTEPMPPWPAFDELDIEAVSRVLRSGRVNYWTGDDGVAFETEFAEAHGVEHAIAMANGTVTLEAALAVLGVGAGDEVVVPARTFIATASAVVARGAVPVIADVDAGSGNVTSATIEAALSPRTRAVIVVHLGGWPCDMDPIMEVASAAGIAVIEDCAQALGGRYKGRPLGTFGAFGSFSFCQDKIVTTGGEGGMLITSDAELFERAWSLKDHGKSRARSRAAAPAGSTGFRWLHDSFGTNWRMTGMQAALGSLAMRKLESWVERRRRSAGMLDDAFAGLEGLRLAIPGSESFHAYYKYYAYVRPERLAAGWDRDRVIAAIAAEGVPCFSGTCPEIYLERAFTEAGFGPAERLPVARELGETSVMLLVHPTLGDADIADTAKAVRKVMAVATG